MDLVILFKTLVESFPFFIGILSLGYFQKGKSEQCCNKREYKLINIQGTLFCLQPFRRFQGPHFKKSVYWVIRTHNYRFQRS
jgi:hypothetical protein